MKKIVIMFCVTCILAFSSCQKEEINEVPDQPFPAKISLDNTAWEGKMVNSNFADTYWEETLVFMSDTIALLFRKAIYEGELTGARTIETNYSFDGVKDGVIFKEDGFGGTDFTYDTINGEITLTILDYYPHIFHKLH